MLALLAIATLPLPAQCNTTAYYSNKLPFEEMAMCQVGFFARYDELVKFRKVKAFEQAWVCGEIDKDMEGFQLFKYVDHDNWIVRAPLGNARGQVRAGRAIQRADYASEAQGRYRGGVRPDDAARQVRSRCQ